MGLTSTGYTSFPVSVGTLDLVGMFANALLGGAVAHLDDHAEVRHQLGRTSNTGRGKDFDETERHHLEIAANRVDEGRTMTAVAPTTQRVQSVTAPGLGTPRLARAS
ncbi:hypothetical protein B1790_14385 [Mycobacterium sp. AT1]|nr:hypothetical protein B1790_14385 [Mycobacterium sp. AT1]